LFITYKVYVPDQKEHLISEAYHSSNPGLKFVVCGPKFVDHLIYRISLTLISTCYPSRFYYRCFPSLLQLPSLSPLPISIRVLRPHQNHPRLPRITLQHLQGQARPPGTVLLRIFPLLRERMTAALRATDLTISPSALWYRMDNKTPMCMPLMVASGPGGSKAPSAPSLLAAIVQNTTARRRF